GTASGQVSGRLFYSNLSRRIILANGSVTALTVGPRTASGRTSSLSGSGTCFAFDPRNGADGNGQGMHDDQNDDQALANQGRLSAEATGRGRPCRSTVTAVDSGRVTSGDSVTITISGFGPDGGPVIAGDVRVIPF